MNVLPAELALQRRAARGTCSGPRPPRRPRPAALGGTIGACWASITSRAVAPFWRASTKRPGTSIVRMTFGAPETSISVTIVVSAPAPAWSWRDRPPGLEHRRDVPFAEIDQHAVAAQQQPVARCRRARASRSPRRWPTSITRSVRSVTANIRLPSVLRMSGSSTSISCVFVPEKSGTRRRSACRRRRAARRPARATEAGPRRRDLRRDQRRRHHRVDQHRRRACDDARRRRSSAARPHGRSRPAACTTKTPSAAAAGRLRGDVGDHRG